MKWLKWGLVGACVLLLPLSTAVPLLWICFWGPNDFRRYGMALLTFGFLINVYINVNFPGYFDAHNFPDSKLDVLKVNVLRLVFGPNAMKILRFQTKIVMFYVVRSFKRHDLLKFLIYFFIGSFVILVLKSFFIRDVVPLLLSTYKRFRSGNEIDKESEMKNSRARQAEELEMKLKEINKQQYNDLDEKLKQLKKTHPENQANIDGVSEEIEESDFNSPRNNSVGDEKKNKEKLREALEATERMRERRTELGKQLASNNKRLLSLRVKLKRDEQQLKFGNILNQKLKDTLMNDIKSKNEEIETILSENKPLEDELSRLATFLED